MTRFVIPLLVIAVGCGFPAGPAKVRPGSNIALPADRPSIAATVGAEVVRTVICGKGVDERSPEKTPGDPCRQRSDSLGPKAEPKGPPETRRP